MTMRLLVGFPAGAIEATFVAAGLACLSEGILEMFASAMQAHRQVVPGHIKSTCHLSDIFTLKVHSQ